jgi:AraC-like DNA-binding protein
MSVRSLERRLAEESTTFRSMRDEMRRDLAIEHICRGDSVTGIASELGFSDTPSFHRAFRRWTGRCPGSYKI